MLAEAIKVVEAARALDPSPGAVGLYRLNCEPRHIHRHLRELAEAIERFDMAVGHGADAKALLGRALHYASQRGIDIRAMMEAISAPAATGVDATEEQELVPRPGELGEPDRIQDIAVGRQSSRDGAAHLGREPDIAHDHDPLFPGTSAGLSGTARPVTGTTAPLDPTEARPAAPRPEQKPRQEPLKPQPEDQRDALKLVEDRLVALAAKHGWTPKLQQADAALRQAEQSMVRDVSPMGEPYHLLTEEATAALAALSEDLEEMEGGREDPDGPEAGFTRRGPGLF